MITYWAAWGAGVIIPFLEALASGRPCPCGHRFTRHWVAVAEFLAVWCLAAAVLTVLAALTVHVPWVPAYGCLGAWGGTSVSWGLAWLADWWQRRRPDRTAAAYGAKSLARIEDLAGTMRDLAMPKPVPGGAG